MDPSRLDERHVMVDEQLQKRGIRNPWLLQAMLDVPRHLFVPPDEEKNAYLDGPLPIGKGQTISQPFIVASMIELIEPAPHKKVLEVGVGCGYSAAVLSRVVGEVLGVEREGSFLEGARERWAGLGIANIRVREGDGSLGWKEEAPYDAILVTAAAPRVPQALLTQLKTGGILIVPVGNRDTQNLVRVTKRSETSFQEKELYPVRFVPLVGAEGWPVLRSLGEGG